MSFFDDFSHFIGTDGSGGGAVVDAGKALGFGDSTTGLLNNPGVKEAVVIGGVVYGVGAGAGLFGSAEAATTAAEIGATSAATGGVALVPLEVVAAPSATATMVTPVVANSATAAGLWETAQTVGGYAMKGLDLTTKVVGGINVLQSLNRPTGASSAAGKSGVSNLYISGGGLSAAGETSKAPAANSSSGVSAAARPKDSTLTILASGLTVAAILYQFYKGK
jgi:hypothetical protein